VPLLGTAAEALSRHHEVPYVEFYLGDVIEFYLAELYLGLLARSVLAWSVLALSALACCGGALCCMHLHQQAKALADAEDALLLPPDGMRSEICSEICSGMRSEEADKSEQASTGKVVESAPSCVGRAPPSGGATPDEPRPTKYGGATHDEPRQDGKLLVISPFSGAKVLVDPVTLDAMSPANLTSVSFGGRKDQRQSPVLWDWALPSAAKQAAALPMGPATWKAARVAGGETSASQPASPTRSPTRSASPTRFGEWTDERSPLADTSRSPARSPLGSALRVSPRLLGLASPLGSPARHSRNGPSSPSSPPRVTTP
jgi:hypothetical protein